MPYNYAITIQLVCILGESYQGIGEWKYYGWDKWVANKKNPH
jgi:hypothetical protein